MTTMNEGIRTISGIRFLMAEITTLEHISTNIVASPIPIPLIAEEVVPSVGHIPSRSTNVGFSLIIPFIITLKLFISSTPFSFSAECIHSFGSCGISRLFNILLSSAGSAVGSFLTGIGSISRIHCIQKST